MSLKDDVLQALAAAGDDYRSGESLAQSADVSRAAIWKAIKQLEKEGHHITGVRGKGYRLCADSDALSAALIGAALAKPHALEVHAVLDSTNERAKQLALSGSPHGTTVIANAQSKGKGRLGRSFYSPEGNGIYMSMILRSELSNLDAVLTTTAAAVAVAQALEDVCGVSCGIKWVNDLYLGEGKVCGILTEAMANIESGTIDQMILGIGINVWPPTEALPQEIAHKVGYIWGDGQAMAGFSRNRLIARIIDEVEAIIAALPDRAFLRAYRRRSIVLGKEITYTVRGAQKKGRAIAINDDGALVVEDGAGAETTLYSGEISIVAWS